MPQHGKARRAALIHVKPPAAAPRIAWGMNHPSLRSALGRFLLLAVLAAASTAAVAQPAAQSRGQLLYNTHCIECHTMQMHWRANSRVNNWDALVAQVTRWQANAKLGWNESDIGDVAHYLNDTIYHLALPAQNASR
jgi:mono/diheme cytochrome c family protein